MGLLGLVSWTQVGVIAVLSVAVALYALWLKQSRELSTMNGPKGWPFIGLGISLPKHAPDVLRNWARRYGEVYKIRVGGYNWVVVNTPEAVKEIFDRQSISTSSKPPLPYGHDLVTKDMRIFTMEYGQKWRTYRTLIHQLLRMKVTLAFQPSQEYEVKQLLYECANENQNERDFYFNVRRMSMSILATSTLGRRIDTKNHIDIQKAGESMKLLAKITRAGMFPEDELPVLMYLPNWMQPSFYKASAYAKILIRAKMHIWNRLVADVEGGDIVECYGKELVESDYKGKGLTDEDASWIVGGLVEAGSETTSVTLLNLILHLAANPDVQARAHEELSRVVGDSRMPTFEDIPNLPYIRGCIKEIMRIAPVPTFGIKHYTDEEIVYKNHVIPKGTVLLANTTTIHFDPHRYPEPFKFKPERYLNHPKSAADYLAITDPLDRDHFTFGVGRRVCPGSRLAENTLNIAAACLLWAFELRPPMEMGPDGKEREAKMDLSDNAYDQTASFKPPKPFRCRFVPRTEKQADLIRDEWLQARTDGYDLRGIHIPGTGDKTPAMPGMNGHANGNANGNANGHANGHANGVAKN